MPGARTIATRVAFPVVIACAALAPLAIHWLGGQTLVWFDTERLYAPERWLVDEALRAFRLPLWNPYLNAGTPLLADAIHGVLHPVSVVTAWLGTDRSADVLIGGYVALAALGAALLARDLGASRSGAAVTAFAFGMSGYVLSMAGNLVFLAGSASLPFCVAGLRRFAVAPRPAYLVAGAAGAAVLAFSGDAQALMVGGALALAVSWEVGGWRGALRAVVAGALGLAIAGVQLVPTAAHLPRTLRSAEAWVRRPEIWALEPWRLAELVVPGLLRGPDPLLDRVFEGLAGPGRWPGGGLPIPFSQSVFVGLLPVALAVAGALESRRGKVLGALALLLLWLALGTRLGADAVAARVPIWRAFQYSEKLVGPLTLVVAVLAGLGLDAVVERRVSRRRVLAVGATLAIASIAACWLVTSTLPPAVAAVASARVAAGTWHALAAAGVLAAWLVARDRLGVAGARLAMAAAVWGVMAAAAPVALRPGDPDARLRSPGPALRAAAPGPRIVTAFVHDPLSTAAGLDWADQVGVDHSALGHPAYNVRARLDSLSGYEAMAPARAALVRRAFGAEWPAAARRYGATHVVLDSPETPAQALLHEVATRGATRVDAGTGRATVWALPHREWASFPVELRLVEGVEAAALETVRAHAERSDAAVVETWTAFRASPGRVLSIERGLESLRVEAESEADATLVVADAWWPGWEATVDGRNVAIFPADVLVRAVRWPAGRHVLDMRYRPPEVRSGILCSLLALAILAGWAALLRRRRARTA